ncbi:hypothetical protein LSAT2_015708 [Lamellibrachia satsuma]|nr:hypothetical protein LSAT2_015708 [Lamellibrachia satsuma]
MKFAWKTCKSTGSPKTGLAGRLLGDKDYRRRRQRTTRASRTVSLGRRRCDMAKVLLVTVVVTLLAHHRSSGTYCRFANTSASQGSCIFPCRCTDGCNTTTGDCLNSGQCGVGHPSVATWSGTACQTGNVAYGKNASQSIVDGVADFPAGRAVDGDTNPDMSEGHCAHPDTAEGSNAWWMVDLGGTYNIYKVIVYTRGDSSG